MSDNKDARMTVEEMENIARWHIMKGYSVEYLRYGDDLYECTEAEIDQCADIMLDMLNEVSTMRVVKIGAKAEVVDPTLACDSLLLGSQGKYKDLITVGWCAETGELVCGNTEINYYELLVLLELARDHYKEEAFAGEDNE